MSHLPGGTLDMETQAFRMNKYRRTAGQGVLGRPTGQPHLVPFLLLNATLQAGPLTPKWLSILLTFFIPTALGSFLKTCI